MTGVSFERAKELLGKLRRVAPASREEWLRRACGGDRALHDEVLSLLRHAEAAPEFLEEPASGAAAMLGALAPVGAGGLVPHAPTRIGKYRILRLLGMGGMGAVYEAEQDSPRRRVALKMMRPGLATPEMLQRFRREAELLGRMHHPGIAQIHDAGTVDLGSGEQPWFVMELVEGRPLTTYAREEGLDRRARLQLFVAVCEAVHHAHEQGVLHRDLKPDNILVTDGGTSSIGGAEAGARPALGRPKILDFGVGRLSDADAPLLSLQTSTGQLVGTLPYMSPEQVAGNRSEIDARSDVYALGVVLFELLAGRLPHELAGRPVPEVARIIREDDPLRLSTLDAACRGDLDTIVAKALEKEPARRYASAAALGADVLRHLRHEPIAARPASTFYQLRKFARRHKTLVAGVASTFVALVLGLVVSIKFALGEAEQRELSQQREAQARFETYRASLAAAVASADPLLARESLQPAPSEYRGWEYAYLWNRSDPIVADYAAPGEGPVPGAPAWPASGGPRFAWARDRELHLVALDTGADVSLGEQPGRVTRLALTAEAGHLAALLDTDGDEGQLRVWALSGEPRTARLVLERPVPADAEGLALAPDGARVALTIGRRRTELLDAVTGELLAAVDARVVNDALDFAADGSGCLVVSGEDRLTLLGPDGARDLGRLVIPFRIAVAPVGDQLAVPDTIGVRLRGLERDTMRECVGERFLMADALAFSRDGTLLAWHADARIEIWDTTKLSAVSALPDPPDGVASGASLVFGPQRRRLMARTTRGARVWDLEGGGELVLRGSASHVYDAVFSPDGRLLASAGGGEEVRLWDALSGECLDVLRSGWNNVFGVAFSRDGTRVLATIGKETRSWDVALGAASMQVVPTVRVDDWGSRHLVAFYGEATGGSRTTTLRESTQSFLVNAGRTLEADATRGQVRVRRFDSDEEVLVREPDDGRTATGSRSVGLSADGRLVALGYRSGLIALADATTGEHLADLPGHQGPVYSLDFSPDGTRLASASRDFTARIWDIAQRKDLLVIRDHADYVHSVRFSPDGTQLATSSGDRTVRLYDALPLAERRRRQRLARGHEERLRPVVQGLLQVGEDAAAVAARLRADPVLDADERAAALRVLLVESSAR